MSGFLTTLVEPYYSKILHANYVRQLSTEEQLVFNQGVVTELSEIDKSIIARLLAPSDWDGDPIWSPDWKEKITGSWFCGLKGWQEFETIIGELLLSSKTWYAGQGYCFALACFATDESAAYLINYLEVYLPQTSLEYDQKWAMPALMWVDEQRGTYHSHRFLVAGGLWEQYGAGREFPYWEIEECKRGFWAAMQYCRMHFSL